METKTVHPPVINLNLWVQNHINIYPNKEDSCFSAQFPHAKQTRDPFTKEYAKGSPNNFNSTKLDRNLSSPANSLTSLGSEQETLPSLQIKEIEKTSQIYEERASPSENSHLLEILGFFLIGFSALVFILGIYAIILSPIIGETGHVVLDFVRNDNYYTLLIPLMAPITVIVGYFNWVSIKFLRHS